MVGNDIVDLKLALIQSNWQRKGFLKKIFTEEEQKHVLNSNNSFQTIWLFWSMKESAYKVYVQKYQHRFFAPKKFGCKLISNTEGYVVIDDECYYTTSKISSDFIFTEAVLRSDLNLVNDCVEFEHINHSYQSKKIYEVLRTEVSKNLKIPITELHLKKNKVGIPKLYQNNKHLKASFSISHHGNYGAFSLLNTF